VRLSETLALPVPVARTICYRPHAQKDLILGLRPEHITEARSQREPGTAEFAVPIEVVEPMGMFRPIVRSLWLKQVYHGLFGRTLLERASRIIAAKPDLSGGRA